MSTGRSYRPLLCECTPASPEPPSSGAPAEPPNSAPSHTAPSLPWEDQTGTTANRPLPTTSQEWNGMERQDLWF